ncbi:MAG: bifunctional glycosyltransferase family 2/GtrA family protein [Lachnospiraceae bacterium]|nr:bifunctional glycosyltransferase family 2/GtrA family protein [Lachnospiraceae bacterium]
MKVLIVIPALNPDSGLIGYVDTLLSHGYEDILVVDDGSRANCRYIFDEIEKKKGCVILRHDVNLGKGRALKDAMVYFLDRYEDAAGMITVDSDGQHTIEDVNKVAACMKENPDSLILGARDFYSGGVPPKSLFGNRCTRIALKLFIGGDIHDTQTGLRAIPSPLIRHFSDLHGERFEYETVQLIDAIHSGIDIREVPIRTVYINNNSETHFNPIKDSIRIYSVIFGTFFRYALSSLSSFVVDYGVFCGLFYVLARSAVSSSQAIWISTVIARIISSLFNYTVNKKIVFKSKRGAETFFMYYGLCIVQMACSAALVNLVDMLHVIPVQIAKIIVDTLLFLISYRIQKRFVFGKKLKNDP